MSPKGSPAHAQTSRWYGPFTAGMAVCIILANIGATKGVMLGPFIVDGGFFLIPFCYILGDVITEVYGFKRAFRAIATSFILSFFSSVCFWVIILLPGLPNSGVHQAAIERVLGPEPIVAGGSLLAFLGGQLTNSLVVVRLKKRSGEKKLWVRFMASSWLAEGVDTFIFSVIAGMVIGLGSFQQFAYYFIIGVGIKAFLEIALLPLTAWVVGLVKEAEPTYPAYAPVAEPKL